MNMNFFNTDDIQKIRNLFLHRDFTNRDFPQEALELIYNKNLFKLYIPDHFKGKECTFREALEYFIHTAYIDGDFGWAVQIGSGGGIFSGYVQLELANSYFTQDQFVIAGSGHPTATAKATKNGYIVDGSWKYCSGSEYATLITGSCATADGVLAVALDPNQVAIQKDWNTQGMVNTVSHTIIVKEQFVPVDHTFQVSDIVESYDYKMFSIPFKLFAKANIFATTLGCFQHLLEEAKNISFTENISSKRFEGLLVLHEEASTLYNTLEVEFLVNAEACWDVLASRKSIPDEVLMKVDAQIDEALNFIKSTSYDIFLQAGMRATQLLHPLNKIWRDITTVFHHAALK